MKFRWISMALMVLAPHAAVSAAEPITIWHTLDSRHAKFFATEIIAPFVKASGIKINIESGMDVRSSLLTGRAKGVLPDVVFSPWDIIALAEIVPFAAIAPEDMPALLSERDVETVKWQKTIYGIPVLSGNHLVLYYNKNFVPKPATNWEELTAQKATLAKKKVRLLAIDYGVPYTFSAFLSTFGPPMIDDKARPQLATTGCQKALEFYRDLTRNDIVQQDCDYRCTTKDFFAGEYAYSLHGDWAYHDAKAALGDNLGVSLLPAFGKTAMRSLRGTHALFFPKANYTTKKKSILALARHLVATDTQTLWARHGFRIPVNKTALSRQLAEADANFAVLLRQLEQAVPLANGPAVAHLWPALKKGVDIFLAHLKDAKATCAFMQSQALRGLPQ